MSKPADAISRLLAVMAALRHPRSGCAWDREQDFATIAPYTIEEAYEVRAAVESGEPAQLKDELGDLLFQVVYLARLAEEREWFDFSEVAQAVTAKMIARHPHVFSGAAVRDAAAQTREWEAQKAAERRSRAMGGTLDGIATALPAMAVAAKLTGRAARVGFDWPDAGAVLDKLAEETAELRAELASQAEMPGGAPENLAGELGDMLFVLVNLARKLDLDAEACLHGANGKFLRRFRFIEAALARQGKVPADSTLAEMDALWNKAKNAGL